MRITAKARRTTIFRGALLVGYVLTLAAAVRFSGIIYPDTVALPVSNSIHGGCLVAQAGIQHPGIVLGMRLPPDPRERRVNTERYYLLSLLLAGVLITLAVVLMDRTMQARLAHLAAGVGKISTTKDLSARVTVDGHDRLAALAMSVNDLLETWQSSQQALRESEERYRNLVEAAPDAVIIHLHGKFIFANTAAARLLGAGSVDEIIGLSVFDIIPPEARKYAIHRLKQLDQGQAVPLAEIRLQPLSGDPLDVEVRSVPFRYRGKPAALVIARDITDKKKTEERLNYLAYYDGLTGLPNRTLFRDRLSQALADARREGEKLAVMLLDLDRFKDVNDTLGHNIGDRLLQAVPRRLQAGLRDSDTVARMGGDEFIFLLRHLNGAEDVEVVARRIVQAFDAPFHLDDYELFITPSLGISLYPADGETPESLIKYADIAMYRAKACGRNAYQFFAAGMAEEVTQKRARADDLRHALHDETLQLYYQPQIDLRTGAIAGMEALLRWQSEQHGVLLPGQIFPLAEEHGLITNLGDWVLQTACRQALRWQQAGHFTLRMSINLSAGEFFADRLAESLVEALRDTGLPPESLELDIAEQTLMLDLERARQICRRLHKLGIRMAIDDFGTGSMPMDALHGLPIDTVKIDRAVICRLLEDREGAQAVRRLIAQAHIHHRKTLAKAVETPEQLSQLYALKCDAAQGYLLGKPAPACAPPHILLPPGIDPPDQLPSPLPTPQRSPEVKAG